MAELWTVFVNSHDSSLIRLTLRSQITSILVRPVGVKRSDCEMSLKLVGLRDLFDVMLDDHAAADHLDVDRHPPTVCRCSRPGGAVSR